MSIRLLSDFGAPLRHGSLDDLESLTWVLIWVALRADLGIKEERDDLSQNERSWIEGLNSLIPHQVKLCKDGLSNYFLDTPDDQAMRDEFPLKSLLGDFTPLLVKLFALRKEAFRVLIKLGDKPEHGALRPNILTCFDKYITALHNFIQGRHRMR